MKIRNEIRLKKKPKNQKAARLIVRNLPFKCNEQSVKEHFSKFGDIVDVKLLKKGDKLVGCGFVQYDNKLNAAKAISKLSGNDFMGRPIIVDWALPKDKFSKQVTDSNEGSHVKSEVIVKEEDDNKLVGTNCAINEVSKTDSVTDDEENENFGEVNSDEESDSDVVSGSDDENSMEDVEDSDGGCSNNPKKPWNEKLQSKQPDIKSGNKQKFKYDPNDVNDGRTVFLKNIPFSVTDECLLKCAKDIGSVIYAIVCVDPLTEHSKGTGFVKFKEKSVVDDLLGGKLKLVIGGVRLEPHLALKKNQIEDMKVKKTPKDNRNLYLVREGVIIAGSPAAEGVSEGDMSKRLQLEHWKTQTLRNLNKFVSATRLVVHNIPPFIDDTKLRQIFKEYSPKGAVIKEVRIMRNLNDVDEHGVGRSKGFGFVSFTKHEHALEALRAINNNPKIFKESKRPIVGFSIESMTALKLKEKRKEKSRGLGNKPSKNLQENKNRSRDINKSNKPSVMITESVPMYGGYVAKPGVKKMRSRKELSAQAQLHHKSTIERKNSKKKNFFNKKFRSRMKGNPKNKR